MTEGTTTKWKSPLYQMTQTTPTVLWNDSAALDELSYSIEHGAVGATCNPVIVLDVLKKSMDVWRPRIAQLIADMPTASEDEIAWKLVELLSIDAAKLLKPIFDQQKGRNGRLSVQTDPRFWRNKDALVAQAVHFSEMAPNIIVKIPATSAGIAAIEEVTYRGVSVNATVSFTLPQAMAVAEAVERGLQRREREGLPVDTMGPVCTIMSGRLDDWMRTCTKKQGIITDPGYLEWAGVAVFKKAYKLYQERGFRTRLLSAAFRNHMHWSEYVGGDVVISPPCSWQKHINASDVTVENRISQPVDPKILAALTKLYPDFNRAYNEHGLSLAEMDSYGAVVVTLRQFLNAGAELNAVIREIMLPNPA
jgi:transaldolase